jgi:hypothetical protein
MFCRQKPISVDTTETVRSELETHRSTYVAMQFVGDGLYEFSPSFANENFISSALLCADGRAFEKSECLYEKSYGRKIIAALFIFK